MEKHEIVKLYMGACIFECSAKEANDYYGIGEAISEEREIIGVFARGEVIFKDDPENSFLSKHCKLKLRPAASMSQEEVVRLIQTNQAFTYRDIYSVSYSPLGKGSFKILYSSTDSAYDIKTESVVLHLNRLTYPAWQYLVSIRVALDEMWLNNDVAVMPVS